MHDVDEMEVFCSFEKVDHISMQYEVFLPQVMMHEAQCG